MSSDLLTKPSDNKPKTHPNISVIIPAYNEQEFIESTLFSLKNSNYPTEQFEIIVVDNGSTDKTMEIAKRHADLLLLLSEGNVGAVRNYGAREASGQFLAFLDADCEVSHDWLTNIELLLEEQNDCAFGGTCTSPKNTNWIERYWLLGSGEKKQKDLVGASIAIRKSDFFSIGGFREDVTSGEDSDLSNRLRNHHISVIVTTKLSVKHFGNANTISGFVRRQIWHSENYLHDPVATVKDPTFILCFLVILLLFLMVISIFIKPNISALSLLSIFLIIGAFSIKRMVYANFFTFNPIKLLKIYCLDAFYVLGRCMGIAISIKNSLKLEK